MKALLLGFTAFAVLLPGQTTVAPTPESPQITIDLSRYTVTQSFEVGYRFGEYDGDQGLYRANVNYGNGLRLLSNTFNANSKDGHGELFDTLLVSTQGLFNDPYSVATARLEKNGKYRYDGTWRKNQYYNPFEVNGESQYLKQTQRTLQDHDLTITAAKWLKLRLGYSRNQDTGPAISAYQLYIGGLYPLPTSSEPGATHGNSLLSLLQNTRQDWNEYRFGGDIDFAGFRLTINRQLSYYKDDSADVPLVPGQPYPESQTGVATSYWRSSPMHTRNPVWFGNLARNGKKLFMDARISYMDSLTKFDYEEAGTGYLSTGTVTAGKISSITLNNALTNVATSNPGVARRPFVSGDLTFSYLVTDKLTISSDTSAQSNRLNSTSQMLQTSTNAATKNIFWDWTLDVKRYSESLDLNYRAASWLGLNANYMYTDRSVDQIIYRSGTTNSNVPTALGNHLNAGTVGFRLKPLKGLSLNLDAGVGRDNGAFTPESLANYHLIKARAEYRYRKLRLSSTYRQVYNVNAPVLYSYDTQHTRGISGTASYELNKRWWLDVSYSKLHQDTFSLLYPELPSAAGPITNVRGYSSVYLSNIHTGTFMSRTQFGRATITLGYTITQDAGDGRTQQNLGLSDPAAAYLALSQTFPMQYQAPLARFSFRIKPKLQWNVGWEYYRYNQQFAYYGLEPYYRASTGYTSLSFAY